MIRKMKYLLSIVLLLVLFGFDACKSGNEELMQDDLLNQNTDKLISLTGTKMKEWKIESYVVNGKNLLLELDNCQIDNMDIYFADHRFESVEGPQKCQENDPYITETGHWYFNEDSTEIEVSIEKDFYILKLIEISPSKLHYISCNHTDTIEAILSPSDI